MPEDKQTERRVGFNELGFSGLVRMGGVIYEEFLPKLQGTAGVRVYKEMRENSAIVGAMIFAVESLLRSVKWKVEPASEEQKDLEAARFVEECRSDMSHTWADFISEILTMLTYGWSYFEIVYKLRKGPKGSAANRSKFSDGKIGWRKFAPRSQDSLWKWEIDRDGGIKGMWQQAPTDPDMLLAQEPVFLPIEKCLLFRTTSAKNNPEGRSILRSGYRPYHFQKRLQEIEAIGAERNLAGMPVAYVPLELLASDRSAAATSTYAYIRDIVQRVKRDEQEGLIFPLTYDEKGNPLFKFELLSAGGTGSKNSPDVRSMIGGYAQEIAMTIMADFLLLGHEGVGSYALSSDKTELFSVALQSWLDAIEDVINRHAIPRLMELNGMDGETIPRVRHSDPEDPNLQELGGFLSALSNAGATLFPDLLLENKLREAAHLPEIDPETYAERLAQKQEVGGPFGGQPPSFGGQQPPFGRPAQPPFENRTFGVPVSGDNPKVGPVPKPTPTST